MPLNWHVKRKLENHSVAELEQIVKDAQGELDEAAEDTREFQEATTVLAFYQRRLDAAKEKEEQRKKDEQLTAKEIVDRVMRVMRG